MFLSKKRCKRKNKFKKTLKFLSFYKKTKMIFNNLNKMVIIVFYLAYDSKNAPTKIDPKQWR